MKKAILFDLDGTIIDSEPLHYKSHKYALKKYGIKLTLQDYIKKGVSRNSVEFYKEMAKL